MKRTILFILIFIPSILFSQEIEEKGKIGGTIFGSYYYNVERDTAISNLKNTACNGEKNINGLALQRALIFYDYKWKTNLTSRISLESDEQNLTVGSDNKAKRLTIYLKDAFVQWKFHRWHSVVMGLQITPPYQLMESELWQNRFLEKTIIDLRKAIPTRDIGISLKGQLDSTGRFKYHLFVANGSGEKPENDKYKRFYLQLEASPINNFYCLAYSDYQNKAKVTDSIMNKRVSSDIVTFALALGYKEKNKYTLALEGYQTISFHAYQPTATNPLETLQGIGISVFGIYHFSSIINAVIRYDYFEPNSKKSGDSRQFIIAACNFNIDSKLTLSPNVVIESYEKTNNKNYKNSITARLSFNWSF